MAKSGLLVQTKEGNYKIVRPPVFNTKLEAQRFYGNEKELCAVGWGGLGGHHYHYLTRGFVDKGSGGQTGSISSPDFRVDDIPVFKEFERLDKGINDLLIYSGRGTGKTELILAKNLYNIDMDSGSKQFVTAADSARLKKLFSRFDKRIYEFNRIHSRVKHVLSEYSNKVDTGIVRTYKKLRVDPFTGEDFWTENEIFGRQTSGKLEDVSNLSGSRGKLLTIEEPFLHKYLEAFLNTADEIIKENGVRIGGIFMAGTLEYNSPPSCAEVLDKLITRSQTDPSLRCLFLPYTHGKYLNPDGTTNLAKAMEEYEKECEIRSKEEDKTRLYEYIKNNPLKPEDVLKSNYAGVFTPDFYEDVESKKLEIKNSRNKIDIGRVTKEGFFPSSDGKIKILEPPIKGVPYLGGIDPIEAINAASTKGSQLVLIIYNPLNETPVALYSERTTNDDKLAENCINLLSMYNNAKAMLETDRGNVLIKNFKIRKMTRLLAERPSKLGLYKGSRQKGETWYGAPAARNQHAKDAHHQYLSNLLNACVKNIEFLEVLEDIKNYPHANSDYIDALKQIALFKADIEAKSPLVKASNMIEVRERVPVPNGRFGIRYEEYIRYKEKP